MQKDHSQHRFCDVVKSISDYRILDILFVITLKLQCQL